MRKQRLIAWSAVLVGLMVVGAVQAQPEPPGKGGPGKPDGAARPGKGKDRPEQAEDRPGQAKHRPERANDQLEQGRDKDKPPHGRAPGHRPALRELLADLKDGKVKKADLKDRLAKLRESVAERRKHHQAELKARWGATLAMPAVREELQHHARRMARLNRALFLAQTELTKNQEKTVERINELIEKEQGRHERAMERFKSVPGTPAASAAAAPSTAPAAQEGGAK
jgi:hypothetical protein